MGVTAGNPNRLHRPLCVADICQAIANGQIMPAVADGCYQISSQDLRTLVETSEEQYQELPASLLLGGPMIVHEASDMGCLA
jgi:hypothetical protein